jgi:cation diffusion facilitator family transporter
VGADDLVGRLGIGGRRHPSKDSYGLLLYRLAVTVQRRTALVSVLAALALIGLKLAAGLEADSLGLLSEAAHSGTDLVAALLTFFAVGVAGRPADPGHPYGHGKAEHLAALAEGAILVALALVIGLEAVLRLVEGGSEVEATAFAFAAVGIVLVIDASRALVSMRAARRFQSAAFATNALHFASDFAGTTAVLTGLLLARAGYPEGDAYAALFVGVLVLAAATRLMRQNVDVLMDRTPARAHEAARKAIQALDPRVELRRLRMRTAAGRHFADVVIGVPPAAGIEQGHAAASAVEAAVEQAVPGSDVVVHVEPEEAGAIGERAYAAALRHPRVREIHNVVVLAVGDRTEVSLHLKLPGSLSLAEAHEVANEVEAEILSAVPEVDAVQTHLEPLEEAAIGRPLRAEIAEDGMRQIIREVTGGEPRELRLVERGDGVVAFLVLALYPERTLADVHALASEVEERIRREFPAIADVVVHTEP